MPRFKIILMTLATLSMIGAGIAAAVEFSRQPARAAQTEAAPPAVPVSVARVESRDLVPWEEFSGRLEAVDRVDLRARVAGQVLAVHFREGGLVNTGDVLVTLDPAPYAAAVARAEAQLASARARVVLTRRELDRATKLSQTGNIPQREVDTRTNAHHEATAAVRAAQAALDSATLDLGYTQVRAPVSGRIGRAEVTAGNLVAAGADAPVLATLVSVNPIYAAFDASEAVVMRARAQVRTDDGPLAVEKIPVRMFTLGAADAVEGHVQMIDNAVDAASGTISVRAVFENPDGMLMPGQFAKLSLGAAKAEPTLLISERAVGTDQDKKFVLVVGDDNRAAYRNVRLGAAVDGLRVVTEGLTAGERIIVNGLQRVRPGAEVAPQEVAMTPHRPQTLAQR